METPKYQSDALAYGGLANIESSREVMFAGLALNSALLSYSREAELKRQIESDALTNLLNKEGITSRVENWMKENRNFGVLVCDLTNFKKLNDTNGHLAGDEFLQKTANIINFTLRTNDEIGRITSREHEASRWGGDEFVILVDLTPHEDKVMEPSERLLVIEERISNIFNSYLEEAGLENLGYGISIGSEVYNPNLHLKPTDIITSADLNGILKKEEQHKQLGKYR